MSIRLAIVGVGGVGGVLAGPLLRTFGGDISLVARGKRGEHLRAHGLTMHSDLFGEFTVDCPSVSENGADLGVQDYVLLCVKNAALEQAAAQIAPMLGERTVVIPVMNGVTAAERLRRCLPRGIVAGSVIYTVSSAGADYSITQQGPFTRLILEDCEETRLLEALLTQAGISCKCTKDIQTDMWSKYVFNCAYNTMTAAESCAAKALKAEPLRSDFAAILAEAAAVGTARGARFPENFLEKEMKRLDNTGDGAESSLSRDFRAKKRGEMALFSSDLGDMARESGVPAPAVERYAQKLRELAATF